MNTDLERTFHESNWKPLKATDETITKITKSQLDIKHGQFTVEKLNVSPRKIKRRKSSGLHETPCMNDMETRWPTSILQRCIHGQKGAFWSSLKIVNFESPKVWVF